MTAIKICGLSTIEHALAAATAGAHLIGLVFVPASRRAVTLDQAAAITAALRQQPATQQPRIVGLFVNESPATINHVAASCGLDYVQLSGDETPQQMLGLRYPLLKALRLNGQPAEADWLTLLQADAAQADLPLAPCPLLVDAHVSGSYGGTGQLADWQQAAAYARQQPLMLAGGLSPDNVADAIAQVRPWGVDVSSGVEHNRRKDPARIAAFVQAARSAAC
jgi:phosphoribosylanthranilate isomerase